MRKYTVCSIRDRGRWLLPPRFIYEDFQRENERTTGEAWQTIFHVPLLLTRRHIADLIVQIERLEEAQSFASLYGKGSESRPVILTAKVQAVQSGTLLGHRLAVQFHRRDECIPMWTDNRPRTTRMYSFCINGQRFAGLAYPPELGPLTLALNSTSFAVQIS